MALRSGYYGLKNSVKRTLEKLASDMSGAKIIKTIGDGLSLSAQGVLAADIDSDTMEFKDHKLAAKIPTLSNYSCEEIYSGSTFAETISFTFPDNKDLDSYDQLLIIAGGVSNKNSSSMLFDVGVLKALAPYYSGSLTVESILPIPHIFFPVYTNDTVRFLLGENNGGLRVVRAGTYSAITHVYGIKF